MKRDFLKINYILAIILFFALCLNVWFMAKQRAKSIDYSNKIDSLQIQYDSICNINSLLERDYFNIIDSFEYKSNNTIIKIKYKYYEKVKVIDSLTSDEQFDLFTKNISAKKHIR